MGLDLETLEEPIARILAAPGTDLSTISAKRVRKTLLGDPAYAFLGLTPEVLKAQREDVDQLIARIFNQVNQAASASNGGSKRKRGEHGQDDGDAGAGAGEGGDTDGYGGRAHTGAGEDADGVSKARRQKKSKKSVEESDAVLARKLSSEINGRSRRSASLAGGVSNGPRKAKRAPKKSSETVASEEEDGDGNKPKKRGAAKGGFAKEYALSDPLSAVLGAEKLSRPQVVKKLWEYIRLHELQNPLNRREIICDDALRAVFAADKIDMFWMNKVLGQ